MKNSVSRKKRNPRRKTELLRVSIKIMGMPPLKESKIPSKCSMSRAKIWPVSLEMGTRKSKRTKTAKARKSLVTRMRWK